MALIYDEYAHFEGLVTNADILEAIVGSFRTDEGAAEPDAVQREDGSWLISGSMSVDEMSELLGFPIPPDRSYETTAGFALAELGRLAQVGDVFDSMGWRFEIVDLDGRRIDKILARRIASSRRRAVA